RLVRDGDRVSAVDTEDVRYAPGVVVVTAGAWSGGLLEPLGLAVPARPGKGRMVLAGRRRAAGGAPPHPGGAPFVPAPGGDLLLGVTVEEAGFDDRVTLDGLGSILERTSALVPAVGRLGLRRAWAGLRPATPDACPVMGPLPLRNLWVSTG